MKLVRILAFLLIITLAFLLIWKGQDHLFAHHTNRYFSPAAQATTLKEGKHIQPFLMGFDNFVADMLWLRAIQYVGGNALSGEFPVLEGYANAITDFDPSFRYVYRFAGLLLPSINQTQAAAKILEKGKKSIPGAWEFPYDLGFIYFYYLDDYEKAIREYQICTQKEGCLRGANRLIDTLRAKSGKVEIAFWSIIDQITHSEEDYEFLEQKAREIGRLFLLREIAIINPPSKDITELVGTRFPSSNDKLLSVVEILEELEQREIISSRGIILESILENPFEFNGYVWDTDNQIVTTTVWKENST